MSWRSQLSLSSRGSYARKKKPLITHDRHLVLEIQLTQVLYPYRGFLVPNPFQKPINFERGGTRNRLIG